jgi:hypothetical protein
MQLSCSLLHRLLLLLQVGRGIWLLRFLETLAHLLNTGTLRPDVLGRIRLPSYQKLLLGLIDRGLSLLEIFIGWTLC